MNLAKAKYGGEVLLQFEDRRPSTCCASHCTFNDDIQGTASVVLGGLLAAVPLTSTPISEQKFVFLGAGTAGTGTAVLIVQAILRERTSNLKSEGSNEGVEQMGPPTWCMQVAAHSKPITYAFRLLFLSPDEANTVYENYLKATTPRVCRYGNPVDTVELNMVSTVDWDGRLSRLYRTGTDIDTNMGKLMILGLRYEVTHDQFQQLLNQHELQTSSIVIPLSNDRYAEVAFADRTTADTALSRFGRDKSSLNWGSLRCM
ncbi:hypothetical protein PF004_g3226 [Phytophthora fragariae]|uniref:Malic enzyme NAD-binding domain-containing protein n=1 Tax=Phytophthora fragariae TaxID=53985 RepID=A0A6G0PM37_9STRA|nr:hypothetical protein PF004_g3226 [Phytophthora fragariae]